MPASTDWNFSGDFTIDFWWYHTANSNSPILSMGSAYSVSIGESSGVVCVYLSSNGSSFDIANGVKIGTASGTGFDRYALVRAGSTYYTFQNGTLTNSFLCPSSPFYSASNSLYIGYWPWNGNCAKGYLDELRISNGIVRWLSNFTPPSSPYTEGSQIPAAAFSASPTGGPAPIQVQLTDTSTGSVTGWSWDFGDGSTSTARCPAHVYSTPGTYTVSLAVSGPGGSNGIDRYTKLMLHLDGVAGSKSFIDSEITPNLNLCLHPHRKTCERRLSGRSPGDQYL